MNPENEFNDRLIRLPELERIFGVCKRTVRRKAEAASCRRWSQTAAWWECWKAK